MNRAGRVVLSTVVIIFFGCGECPPEKPITRSEVPQNVEPVVRRYKAMSYIVGYRITTDTYIITSIYDSGLLGEAASSFGGLGTIDTAKLVLLRSDMEEARAKQLRVIFFGHEIGQSDGKIVIVLWGYEYKQYHQIYGQYKWGKGDVPPN